MRCLSSSLFPSNCSDMTATSKLAPQLRVREWPTQMRSTSIMAVQVLECTSACTEAMVRTRNGAATLQMCR